jgi:peptidoglycan/LPS O-acetylase OafA/YrhL
MDAAKFHIPALDGMRGTALLIVLLAHTTPQIFPGGNIGVDLFFVLSGFLITSILLREHDRTGSIGILAFYRRRALRLLPALFVMVAVVTAYVAAIRPAELAKTAMDAVTIVLYVFNFRLVSQWPDSTLHQPMFSHVWSLSVEEQFYILWPFVLLLTLSRRRLFAWVLAVGIVGPAVARFFLWESGPSLELYFRTDLRFDSLMWGAAGAWLFFTRPGVARLAAMVGLLALLSFLAAARINLLSNGVLYQGGYSLMLAVATMLILASSAPSSWLRTIMEFRPLRWTGKISYGLYLWHVPMFHICGHLPVTGPWKNIVAIALTYGVATISYYGMERYFLALRHPHRRPTVDVVAQTASR